MRVIPEGLLMTFDSGKLCIAQPDTTDNVYKVVDRTDTWYITLVFKDYSIITGTWKSKHLVGSLELYPEKPTCIERSRCMRPSVGNVIRWLTTW